MSASRQLVINGFVFAHYSAKCWIDSDAKLSDFHGDPSHWSISAHASGIIFMHYSAFRTGQPEAHHGWYLVPGEPSYYWTGERVAEYQPALFGVST
jgi:hypothetical protein